MLPTQILELGRSELQLPNERARGCRARAEFVYTDPMSPADQAHLQPIDYWIARLGLQPHPEGGWYAETYRSSGRHSGEHENFPAGRSFATAIYFLLAAGAFSALHRIRSDEVWHFYAGAP